MIMCNVHTFVTRSAHECFHLYGSNCMFYQVRLKNSTMARFPDTESMLYMDRSCVEVTGHYEVAFTSGHFPSFSIHRPANCPTLYGTVPHFEIFQNKNVGQSHILEIIVMANSALKTTENNASFT